MTDHPSGLNISRAELAKSRPPEWAWLGRIPLGYLSLVIGQEGIGKGTITAWLVAKLTRGGLPGHLNHHPVDVAIIGDEDSFNDVWTPRLHAAGADLGRVTAIERPDGGYIELKADRDRLAEAIDLEQIRVAFFDALIDNLGAGVNDWHGKEVREALQPLRWLAREQNVAVIGSMHPNKRGSTFRELVAGSSAFNAISRSSLLLAQHPEDDDRRCLVRGKGNLSAPPAALEFAIEECVFEAHGRTFRVPKAVGFIEGNIGIEELVDAGGKEEHSKIREAEDLIEELLPKDEEWHPAAAVYQAAEAEKIDARTLRRAKSRLKLDQRRETTFQGGSEWRWPQRTPHRSSENSVQSVHSVRSAEGPKSPPINRLATQDTLDSENDSPECVPTGNGLAAENELERLARKGLA